MFVIYIENVFPVDWECFHLIYGGGDVEAGEREVTDMPWRCF